MFPGWAGAASKITLRSEVEDEDDREESVASTSGADDNDIPLDTETLVLRRG